MSAIHRFCEQGNLKQVRALFANDVSLVNARLKDTSDQPLHLAAWQNHAKIVQLLIESSADVNGVGDQGWTPLHYAAYHGSLGSLESAILLLGAGAAPNQAERKGFAPLFFAAGGREENSPDIARLLLKFGAKPDLLTLVRLGEISEIEAYLTKNSNAVAQSVRPDNLIYEAVGMIQIWSMKISSDDERKPVSTCETEAIERGLPLLRMLVEAGADINALAFGSAPALVEALNFQNLQLASWLLKCGADVRKTSAPGKVIWKWLNDNPTRRAQRKLVEDSFHEAD